MRVYDNAVLDALRVTLDQFYRGWSTWFSHGNVEAGLSTERRDTVGRSCLHDACWRPVPDLELMDFLVRSVSPLLLVEEDCRGHSCMDYVRPSDYETWNAFITKYSGLIQRRSKLVGMFAP